MGVSGLILFFGAVFVWAPAAWIYFDAVERRQAPYLWAFLALVPWFNLVVLVVYLILRARSGATAQAGGPDTRLPVYLHVGVLTFWGLAAVGLSALVYGPLHLLRAYPPPFDARATDALRTTLAFAMAVLLVSGPALGVHGWLAIRAVRRASAEAAPSLARMADGLRLLLAVLGGLTATVAVVVLVFWGMGVLFRVGELAMEQPTSMAISVLPASILSMVAGLWLLPRGAAPAAEGEPG